MASFVAPGPSGVAVRTRLKQLTPADEKVLALVGAHLGSLASRDVKVRCGQGLEHSAETWAARKRGPTAVSSSRWAGSLTKATHDQWALASRGQLARIHSLEAGIRTIAHRLSLPIGAKGSKQAPGGYRSKHGPVPCRWCGAGNGWPAPATSCPPRSSPRTSGADAGRRRAGLCRADGESGKRYGNETIRISPDGEVSIKLPAPLRELANAPHGRYILTANVRFPHRGQEWADRVAANRAVAYRIHYNVGRGRWYLPASWQIPVSRTVPMAAALAHGVIGVDMNADHLAAWRLDAHGNPTGSPHRFFYALTGNADHGDAQVRHALTRLLHWARTCGVQAIAVEDLDFTAEKTREKHGRRKRFRQLISGMPTGKLRARLASMADQTGIAIIAVDPAYTSRWGAQHWQKPLTSNRRKTTRHDAAAVAIGRRAQGHPIRRRTAPPRAHQSDVHGHRAVQADRRAPGREGPRPPVPGPRTRSVPPDRGANAGNQNAQHRSGRSDESWQQDSLPLSL
ncbi:IS605 OrfB family transposase [Streptomyces canus]|uniref:IS200/IS605 family accessory protein TnpB-related protein n=1 Tax=Streptomyces canus TaxID=58343 RepID=UPI00278378DF|nr:IS605 OrfB family transposase [Streptomyces canus]